jgi:hypothetical protein
LPEGRRGGDRPVARLVFDEGEELSGRIGIKLFVSERLHSGESVAIGFGFFIG